MTDTRFLQLVRNLFSKEMQNWLPNNQEIDLFDPNNPLDADEFCNGFYLCWSIHYKDEKENANKSKNKADANKGGQNSHKKSNCDDSLPPLLRQGGPTSSNSLLSKGRNGCQGCNGGKKSGDQGYQSGPLLFHWSQELSSGLVELSFQPAQQALVRRGGRATLLRE